MSSETLDQGAVDESFTSVPARNFFEHASELGQEALQASSA